MAARMSTTVQLTTSKIARISMTVNTGPRSRNPAAVSVSSKAGSD
jgi:hypothetical protein